MIALLLVLVSALWLGVGYLMGRTSHPRPIMVTINGTPPTREMLKQIAAELRKVTLETLGRNEPPSSGWNIL